MLVSLGIAAALIWALLNLGGYIPEGPGNGRALTTFDVRETVAAKKSETRQQARAQVKPTRTEVPVPPRAETPPPPPVPPAPFTLPGVISLSRADYAASDIGRIKGTAPPRGSGGDALASSDEGDDSATVGTGPGGEKMYAAEWYREPRRAEMVTYMKPGMIGWGIVACRTIDRYHVEDCRELGETPGSGIARAVRQAAWQFLVRPPRVGGKPQIGAWVRIRYEIVPQKDAG